MPKDPRATPVFALRLVMPLRPAQNEFSSRSRDPAKELGRHSRRRAASGGRKVVIEESQGLTSSYGQLADCPFRETAGTTPTKGLTDASQFVQNLEKGCPAIAGRTPGKKEEHSATEGAASRDGALCDTFYGRGTTAWIVRLSNVKKLLVLRVTSKVESPGR